MLHVINIKTSLIRNSCIVYCGRAGHGKPGSPLANRYVIGRDGSRDEVIEKYKVWLWYEVMTNPNGRPVKELVRILNLEDENKDVYLGCFCAPLRCHCDVIIECARYVEKNP